MVDRDGSDRGRSATETAGQVREQRGMTRPTMAQDGQMRRPGSSLVQGGIALQKGGQNTAANQPTARPPAPRPMTPAPVAARPVSETLRASSPRSNWLPPKRG